MYKIVVAIAVAAGSAMTASASPLGQPGGLAAGIEDLGGAAQIHCHPGRWHHVPTWNYRSDGCRRPARKAKRAPARKASPKTQ